jgi:hypothetical protein
MFLFAFLQHNLLPLVSAASTKQISQQPDRTRPSFHQTPGQTRHGFLFFRDSEDKSRVHLSVTFVLTVSKRPGEVHPFNFSSLLRLRLILTQSERGTERGAGDHTHAEGQGQDKESCQGQDASQQAGGHHDLDREGCLQVVELR